MVWFYLPKTVITIINLIGVMTIAYFCSKLLLALAYRLKMKAWPKNPQEYKYFLLIEENKKLLKKIDSLEKENSEILNLIIKRLKE